MRKVALILLALCALSCGSAKVREYKAQVVKEYPHDVTSYTQGLFFDGGRFIETTGQWGESTLRTVDLETGERCAFIWSDPMAILTDIKAKLDEQRAIREKLAAEMMAVSQPAEPVQTPAPEPAE